MARNIFETQIEACRGHRGQLTALSSFVADFIRSLDAARLADQDDRERSAMLDMVKADARAANNMINKIMGWPVV
jgi:hypothetical protein